MNLDQRKLLFSMVASVALHFGILAMTVDGVRVRHPAYGVPIRAVIQELPVDGSRSPPAMASGMKHSDTVSRFQAKSDRPAMRRFPVARQAAAPRTASVPYSRAALPNASLEESTIAHSASEATAHVGGGVAAPAERTEASADDLRQYRVALAVAARRFRHYPQLARERGWEGTAEISVAINSRRGVPDVTLLKSSGRTVLDQQALVMIEQASASTTLPKGLQGENFRFVLPVEFALADER